VAVTLIGRLQGDAFSEYRTLDGYKWTRGSNQSDVLPTERNLTWLKAQGFTGTDDISPTAPLPAGVIGTVELKSDGRLFVTLVGRLGRDLFSEYRGLDDYRWIRGSESSSVVPSVRNLTWLADNGFTGTEGIREQLAEQLATAAKIAEGSAAATSTLDLSAVTPGGLAPYGFQVAGVEYAIEAKRCFIADEMGLGKTVQAILAVEHTRSLVQVPVYPTVVVCPASLKANWAKEIARWAPSRSVSVLSGRTPNQDDIEADYIIVNYDILAAWVDSIGSIAPQNLIVDESHYAKEIKAQRTKAILKLSRWIPSSGLVLLLTGTPLLNRPTELITQLRILGRLEAIAPVPTRGNSDRDYEFSFKFRYCGPEKEGKYWKFDGVSNARELNDKLRATCFVRRERADVLDLKNTVHQRVILSLNGGLAVYRRAEADVIRYIAEELGTEAALRAKRAETLVQLNTLRRLSEEGKIEATIEWVENWLFSYPEKKLVVFSGHISVQKALVEHFDCPHILGSQKDAEVQKALFQDGDARIIVCSLQAAREGHTLTAASDVVFTSLGWTPGGLQQAEDRCNRIGQEADQVVAWQLHAEDTIDETIADLIAHKGAVFNAVVKGDDSQIDEDVVAGVIDYLASKAPQSAPGGAGPRAQKTRSVSSYRNLAKTARGRQ
jgi:SNF2 family DNA or RNA helicase